MINNLNNEPPWHPGIDYANTELDFLSPDSKDTYNKNCQNLENFKYLRAQNWAARGSITYKLNSHGFRCDEFVEGTDCIMTLGCSFTLGIGLPLQDTWPVILGKSLGITPYNVAFGGLSADTCFRLAEYWIPKLKPKALFMLTPPSTRFDLALAEDNTAQPVIHTFYVQNDPFTKREFRGFLRHWYINKENREINRRKNKLAIIAICNRYSIPYYIYDSIHDEQEKSEMSKYRDVIEFARDFLHPGPPTHHALAELMEKDYRG